MANLYRGLSSYSGGDSIWLSASNAGKIARNAFFGVVVAVGNGLLAYWNGSAWVPKSVKYWTGSAWVVKPMKRWSGTAWL